MASLRFRFLTCTGTLPSNILGEILRILAPDGHLVLAELLMPKSVSNSFRGDVEEFASALCAKESH